MRSKLLALYVYICVWYQTQRRRLDMRVFSWNQVADLGIILVVLYVVVQNNTFLSTFVQTIYTDIQNLLTSLINNGKL